MTATTKNARVELTSSDVAAPALSNIPYRHETAPAVSSISGTKRSRRRGTDATMKKLWSKVRCLMLIVSMLAVDATTFSQAAFSGVYHESSCPSVDTTRMKRMKRSTAEAVGLLPAPDCHPNVRVRYLGVSGASPGFPISPNADTARTIHVGSYTRDDGTQVDEYTRSAHNRTAPDPQN
jgi:hypothetical protein